MREILGIKVDGSDYGEMVRRIVGWARLKESRAVFFANVHVLMEAFDDPNFRDRLNAADMVNPDGMPLVWALRALGQKDASRVYGPDSTVALLKAAADARLSVGFYGGSASTLATLVKAVRETHPNLEIAYAMSPPFRALSPEEDATIVEEITASGVSMLFVGLGCPKQERWVMEHHGRIPAVMLGVGAAFDFLAGSKPQAPRWMMRSGLEWIFRLASEPKRLAGRYIKHNPRFLLLFLHQWTFGRTS
jgi:N-acetylglucosaminyldiphosphoundecaprenol N-acetyl-beta-D-mannosaminyltransferase